MKILFEIEYCLNFDLESKKDTSFWNLWKESLRSPIEEICSISQAMECISQFRFWIRKCFDCISNILEFAKKRVDQKKFCC
jgi:hypothetical protein